MTKKQIKERQEKIKQVAKYLNNDTTGATIDLFCDLFKGISLIVHNTAKEKGWWDSKRSDGECVALMHSELSEALEAMRHGNPKSDHIKEYSGVEEELADVIIRIMDYACAKNLNVVEALITKIAFNSKRPHKHGGKKF